MSRDKKRALVIGGVAAGMSAASRIRRNKPDWEVTVLERGKFVSYGSCGLPYFVSDLVKDVQGLVVYSADYFRKNRGIDVLVRHEASRIDLEGKLVFAQDLDRNQEMKLPYDKLVVCTGASPSRPNLPGIELKNIFVIRTAEDGLALKNFITEEAPRKVAIIGAGLIGLEMAEAFKARGLEVTVIKGRVVF